MKINFIDLPRQYEQLKSEIDAAVSTVFERAAFAGGPFVEEFEKAFAAKNGSLFCAAVNSGTAALHLALLAMEIGPGDEVILPANTFFATAEAVSHVGATPVFIDCDEYYDLDIDKIERVITARTKAVIPVHLYGQPARVGELLPLAKKYNLQVIEDCAQAHFAQENGRFAGTLGRAGCFSFFPGKNLGAAGEGGAVITNDEKLYDKIQMLKNHGMLHKYKHEFIGYNYRMEGLQGAVLSVKLRHIDRWNEVRGLRAAQYCQLLRACPYVTLPAVRENIKHVWHLFVIRCANRDELADFLRQKGIATGIHYPIPCHRQIPYAGLSVDASSLPNTEKWAKEVLSLPMSEQLTEEQVVTVCEAIMEFYKGGGPK